MSRKLFFALLLVGCGSGAGTSVSTNGPAPNRNVLSGIVQSGGTSSKTALGGSRVVLFEATAGIPKVLGTVTADSQGRFSLATQNSTSDTVFYVAAEVRPGVRLVNVLGSNLPSFCTINELTTVGAVYCFNQFIQNDRISGRPLGLRIGAGMDENLVSAISGASSQVILNPPNADQTNSLRSTRALANLLADAIQKNDTSTLFDLATVNGSAPTDTVSAMVNIARNPAHNVNALYLQSQKTVAYAPGLESAPDAWTLCVKVNDTGDDSRLFAGPANTVFDDNGYAWITNNFVQGTPNSGDFAVVLKPNGQPADGLNGTPRSPLVGGGIIGGGYGLDIDTRGHVWLSNYGWGQVKQTAGGTTEIAPPGTFLSPATPGGHAAGTLFVQGVKSDAANNIWMSSYGTDTVVVFPGGDSTRPVTFKLPDRSFPFDVRIASDGTAWVSCSGGFQSEGFPALVHLRLNGSTLEQLRYVSLPIGSALKGVAIDPLDNVWLAAQGGNKIYSFNSNGDQLDTFQGRGGLDSPWGVCLDGNGNLWAADFGPLTPGSVFAGKITCLAGRIASERPLGTVAGDPLTPSSGYNLPSAGAEVTLRNGQPLYNGNGPAQSFEPLQRLTSVEIDQAGNVWCSNNWKPDVSVDADDVNGNPGGDGMVIFLGLAKPPSPRRS